LICHDSVVEIRQVTELPEGFPLLVEQAKNEGFRHLQKLKEDFESGRNCFSQPGEILFAVFVKEELVAVGGINRYDDSARIRRVYVVPERRREGIGKALMIALEEHISQSNFMSIQLRTDTERGYRFYESLGYQPAEGNPLITHIKPCPTCHN
jgi:GNAT superfamily N-acetyltransferase